MLGLPVWIGHGRTEGRLRPPSTSRTAKPDTLFREYEHELYALICMYFSHINQYLATVICVWTYGSSL